MDKRQDATREALVQALSTASNLDRASVEPILRAHGATRVIAGGDDPYTVRAWRGSELIAVTAVPFETDDREHRRCVADGAQALCAVAFYRGEARDPRWPLWALHAALGRTSAATPSTDR